MQLGSFYLSKAYASAGAIGIIAVLYALDFKEWAEVALMIAGALGIVGIRHRLERLGIELGQQKQETSHAVQTKK